MGTLARARGWCVRASPPDTSTVITTTGTTVPKVVFYPYEHEAPGRILLWGGNVSNWSEDAVARGGNRFCYTPPACPRSRRSSCLAAKGATVVRTRSVSTGCTRTSRWWPGPDRGRRSCFKVRNASDFDLDPASTYVDGRVGDPQIGTVHPLTGPVYIEGAEPGDVLAVTLLDIAPGAVSATRRSVRSGFVSDHVTGSFRALWRPHTSRGGERRCARGSRAGRQLSRHRDGAAWPGAARGDAVPGEAELVALGGAGFPPHPLHASPAEICGPNGSHANECLRTLPPREHGGNLDIRYLQVGVDDLSSLLHRRVRAGYR